MAFDGEAHRGRIGTNGAAPRAVRVLMVEDDPLVTRAIGRVLRQAGAEVFDASSIADARSILEREELDVVLSDLNLTDGELGIDLLGEVALRWPNLRRVLWSADDRPTPGEAVVHVRLPKDCTIAELLAALGIVR